MREAERDQLLGKIWQETAVTDKKQKEIIAECLKEEDSSHHLAIEIGRDTGILKKYHLYFDLGTALVLFEEFNNGLDGNMGSAVLAFLKVIGVLVRRKETMLDTIQVMIIIELYRNRKGAGRNLLEDDLLEQVRKQNVGRNIKKEEFEAALTELSLLKCVEITDGWVELKEKVRYQ